MSVPLWAWFAVLGVVVAVLAVDLVAHRGAAPVSVREAAWWSALWVALGLTFGAIVWAVYGADYGTQYLAGYVIEKSLAVDNVVVFALIFTAFAVPREYQHRVLFYGVVGALLMRGIFITLGTVVISTFSWVLILAGLFLIWVGVKMARRGEAHPDPTQSRGMRLFRRFVPMTDEYHGQRFFVRRAGALVATPLLAVLVMVEISDLVFAIDSIPAVFAVTQEPFLVFTSNAFAILGLRAMYFLLAHLVHRFVYLQLGLAVVLVFVGLKLVLLEWVKVPTLLSLSFVATAVTIAVVASLRATSAARPVLSDTHPSGGSDARHDPTLDPSSAPDDHARA